MKCIHRAYVLNTYTSAVEETLFFASPSTSGLAAAYQVWSFLAHNCIVILTTYVQEKDLIQFYVELRNFVRAHKDKTIDTSGMHIVPTQ